MAIIKTLFKLSFPLWVLILPCIILWGALYPWQEADVALESYKGKTKLLIGASHKNDAISDSKDFKSHTYIIIPDSFNELSAYKVKKIGIATPSVERSTLLFFSTPISYLVSLILTFYFWVVPYVRRQSWKT